MGCSAPVCITLPMRAGLWESQTLVPNQRSGGALVILETMGCWSLGRKVVNLRSDWVFGRRERERKKRELVGEGRREGENVYIWMCCVLIVCIELEVKLWDVAAAGTVHREGDIKEPLS